jgi:hypothetical protein
MSGSTIGQAANTAVFQASRFCSGRKAQTGKHGRVLATPCKHGNPMHAGREFFKVTGRCAVECLCYASLVAYAPRPADTRRARSTE